MNIFFRKTIWWLLLAFIISVAVRIPNLDRPLSKHHEFCTAFALVIMQTWYDGGIGAYSFNPSVTYPGESNQYIRNYSVANMQRDGKYFYLSHPPLAYYLPYFTFILLKIYPDAMALQMFNLFFHFITAILFYLCVCIVTRENPRQQFSEAGFFAAIFYLFMPATLWFNSNVYMADMFVQNTWIICLYFLLVLFFKNKESSILYLGLFSGSLFLMIYTDWLGVFFSAAIVLTCIVKIFIEKNRKYILLLCITSLVCLASLIIILFQYSTIAGWSAMLRYYTYDYGVRGMPGILSLFGFSQFIEVLAFNYSESYLPLLLLLTAGLYWIWKNKKWNALRRNDYLLFGSLTLFPVILDHIIFPEYSGQDFSVLKASFFICAFSGILLSHFTKQISRKKLLAFSSCVIGISIYYFINLPGDYSFKGDKYDAEKNIGAFIHSNAAQDETVFIAGIEISPQIVYYAHRNIQPVRTREEAANFLDSHLIEKGILFSLKNDSLEYKRIARH